MIKQLKKEKDDLGSENSSLEKALAKIKKGELKQLGEEVSTLRATVEKLERTSAEAEEERDTAVSQLAEAKAGSQQRILDLEKRVKGDSLINVLCMPTLSRPRHATPRDRYPPSYPKSSTSCGVRCTRRSPSCVATCGCTRGSVLSSRTTKRLPGRSRGSKSATIRARWECCR